MSLTLWKKSEPFDGNMARFRDEMDRTLERFFTEPFGAMETKAGRTVDWLPALDIGETDAEVTIRAEVPGIPAKDINLSITGNVLTISGEKEQKEEQKKENFYQCERRFGSFRRVLELPETVDADKISAEADNGVVTIKIAKKPGAKPRQVEIKPAAATVKKVTVNG